MTDAISTFSGFRARGTTTDADTKVLSLTPDKKEPENFENLLLIPINKEIAEDFSLIGYDDTIRHIEEVLTQASKRRNILLYGNQGVGKSAITQGLVQRKNRRDLSTHMYKRTFYRLNSSKLLHTDDVAEINKQFYSALSELGHYDVLVIENFYTLVSHFKAKGVTGALVAYLEALSRRKLQSIITCNSREKTLLLAEAGDIWVPEIHEFFSLEEINEPSSDELLNILRGVRKSYEARYSVIIPDESIRAIRDLTQKYRNGLEGWAQPGRSLIVLDRAIAQFSVSMNSKSSELNNLENESDRISNELQALCNSDDINDKERCDQLSKRFDEISPRLTELRQQWGDKTKPILELQQQKSDLDRRRHGYMARRRELMDLRGDDAALVAKGTDATSVGNEIAQLNSMIATAAGEIKKCNDKLAKINLSDIHEHRVMPENVTQTFSELSGIDVKQLSQNERERVLNMEEIIGKRVFGQPVAIKLVANAVRRSKAKLSAKGKPLGSFLFLGPSGVGKTELGKALAEFETGRDEGLIRMDMSEYMEKHAVSRLIGAPPGYAGYDEGGTLTEAVRKRPKSVVMFDEIEKAHPDIFKVLLQILGDGRLTDGRGDTVDFSETYVVLTSNAGTPHFLDERLTYEEAEKLALKDVEAFLLPEIRGRLGSIVCFQRLQLPMLVRVAQKRINDINKEIEGERLQLIVAPDDLQRFCVVYQDPRYGARSILKALETTMEMDLASEILSLTVAGGGTFTATFGDTTFSKVTFVPHRNC